MNAMSWGGKIPPHSLQPWKHRKSAFLVMAMQGGGKIPPPSNSRRLAEFVHGEDGEWQSLTPAIKGVHTVDTPSGE